LPGSVVLPSAATLPDIHARLLARDGGAPGLRDPGAVEAAIARPQHLADYAEGSPDVPRLAAALAYAICRIRHPFVDGNKRVAFAALLVTLGLNELALDAAETEAAQVIIKVAGGEMAEAAFGEWVAAHTVAAET